MKEVPEIREGYKIFLNWIAPRCRKAKIIDFNKASRELAIDQARIHLKNRGGRYDLMQTRIIPVKKEYFKEYTVEHYDPFHTLEDSARLTSEEVTRLNTPIER